MEDWEGKMFFSKKLGKAFRKHPQYEQGMQGEILFE